MERLTFRTADGTAMMKMHNGWKSGGIALLAAYEDTGLAPGKIKEADNFLKENYSVPLARLVEAYALLKAKDEGRLLVLPCKVGDTVYVIDWYLDCEIDGFGECDDYEKEGDRACGYCGHNYVRKIVIEKKYEPQMIADIGKTIFLTREEAEAALAMEGK